MARWSGWWTQCGLGRQMMRYLVLEIEGDGAVHGRGEDCVGVFTFQGLFRPDGTVSLLKQYLGRHQVLYEGRNSGEGIYGTWKIPPSVLPGVRLCPDYNSGEFALRPETTRHEDAAAITQLVPVSL